MDRAQIHIDADPEVVYDLVADITNMGRWSPETYRAEWVDGATAAVPGARFRGWNRTKVMGVPATWRTTCTIRQADRGRAFSFDTPFSGARWTYRFAASSEGGCDLEETREEVASPLLVKVLYGAIGSIRRRQLADGMEVTLQRLKAHAEGAGASA